MPRNKVHPHILRPLQPTLHPRRHRRTHTKRTRLATKPPQSRTQNKTRQNKRTHPTHRSHPQDTRKTTTTREDEIIMAHTQTSTTDTQTETLTRQINDLQTLLRQVGQDLRPTRDQADTWKYIHDLSEAFEVIDAEIRHLRNKNIDQQLQLEQLQDKLSEHIHHHV